MSIARLNPQSRSFISQKSDGKFEAKPVSGSCVIKNTPPQQTGPAVLSTNTGMKNTPVKTLY